MNLPDSVGMHALSVLRELYPFLPVVVLNGNQDDSLSVAAVRAGAQDYLQKDGLSERHLCSSISHAMERQQLLLDVCKSAKEAETAQVSLQMALDASETGIWSYDLKSQLLIVDNQVLKIFGIDANDFKNDPQWFFSRILPEDREGLKQAWLKGLKTELPVFFEFRLLWADESIHVVSSNGRVLLSPAGTPWKITGTCRVVSEQKFRHDVEKRLAVLQDRDDFIAALAHDLRVPLVGTERILSLMVNGNLGKMDPAHVALLEKIRSSEQQLLLMINNLLDVYKLEAGAESFDFSQINLAALVTKCCDDLSLLIQTKRILIEQNIATESSIYADSLAMQRVICNLLSNAIKFSPPESTITVTVVDIDNNVQMRFKDSGPGIPENLQDRLFERFWQSSKTDRAIGTGIGLYFCRKVVEAHHGIIVCLSQEGNGTEFVVELPRTAETTPRVLIVDDNNDMLRILAQYLKRFNLRVDLANGGYEAVKAALETRYDAIFMDLQMPDFDGYSASRAIRKNGSKVPIIAYSAYFESREKLAESGICDVLEKPLSETALSCLIERYLVKKSSALAARA